MTPRRREAGVTLIEMLAALAVAAMIGVAGFTFLEGITRQDARLNGRLETIMTRDRAFAILERDVARANVAVMEAENKLVLSFPDRKLTWQGGENGLWRRIDWRDGRFLTQEVLEDETGISAYAGDTRAIMVTLPKPEIIRIMALAGEFQ